MTDAPTPDAQTPADRPPIDSLQMARSTRAIRVLAMALVQIVGGTPADVPRLCTSAACGLLEDLIETYARREEEARTRGRLFYHGDRMALKAELVEATTDLIAALEEGLKTVHEIRLSLVPKENH